MNRLKQQIGDRIRALREGKGWFQEDLAKASRPRLTTRTIGRIERGEVDVRLSTLNRIAKALGEPLKSLIP
jgi:transcriptional regulator with XRE-family HTH domain